jgi:hypothetical protein
MDPQFKKVIDRLHPSFGHLLAMKPVTPKALPSGMPTAGIYLFTERGRHLYVGRSNNIRQRLRLHWRSGATHHMATFAFRLAREATGKLKATYKPEGSRGALIKNPRFRKEFERQKARIGAMQVRFVEEVDPVRQAVLEVYVAVALQTPYNDFDTH